MLRYNKLELFFLGCLEKIPFTRYSGLIKGIRYALLRRKVNALHSSSWTKFMRHQAKENRETLFKYNIIALRCEVIRIYN